MNSKQAKQIPLQDYLSKLGHEPVKKSGKYLYYFSPFRDETKPSFTINLTNNTFKDWGNGEKGKIIQFNIVLFSDSVSQALERIDNIYNHKIGTSTPKFSSSNQKKIFLENETEEKSYKINKVQELQNIALIQYINSRCINIKTAKKYLLEIYYTLYDHNIFSVAFKNNSNGFETRNKYDNSKRSLLKKDITTVCTRRKAPAFIFEGWSDFLSFLTYFNIVSLKKIGSVIVLNSNSFMERALEEIKKINPTKLILLLNNDKSGYKANEFFEEKSNIEIHNWNTIYSDYNDFNDFLIAQKKEK